MTINTTGKRLFSFEDAGRYIDVSRSRIYQLVNAGEIRAVHVGRLHKIAVEELDAYIDGLQATTHPDDQAPVA